MANSENWIYMRVKRPSRRELAGGILLLLPCYRIPLTMPNLSKFLFRLMSSDKQIKASLDLGTYIHTQTVFLRCHRVWGDFLYDHSYYNPTAGLFRPLGAISCIYLARPSNLQEVEGCDPACGYTVRIVNS